MDATSSRLTVRGFANSHVLNDSPLWPIGYDRKHGTTKSITTGSRLAIRTLIGMPPSLDTASGYLRHRVIAWKCIWRIFGYEANYLFSCIAKGHMSDEDPCQAYIEYVSEARHLLLALALD